MYYKLEFSATETLYKKMVGEQPKCNHQVRFSLSEGKVECGNTAEYVEAAEDFEARAKRTVYDKKIRLRCNEHKPPTEDISTEFVSDDITGTNRQEITRMQTSSLKEPYENTPPLHLLKNKTK